MYKVIEYRGGDWGEDYMKMMLWGSFKEYFGKKILSEEMEGEENCDIRVVGDDRVLLGERCEFDEFGVYWFNYSKLKGKVFKLKKNWWEMEEVSKEEVEGVVWKDVMECEGNMKGNEIEFDEMWKYVRFN